MELRFGIGVVLGEHVPIMVALTVGNIAIIETEEYMVASFVGCTFWHGVVNKLLGRVSSEPKIVWRMCKILIFFYRMIVSLKYIRFLGLRMWFVGG